MSPAAQDEKTKANAGDLRTEFQALTSGCGIYRLDRGKIVLTGSDRVRWLNGMVTNNVRDLAPGRGVYAFVLNPQGKIQGDMYAFNGGERLQVETERIQLETVLQIFDRYIIMDDVEVQNVTGNFTSIGVAGPKSGEALTALGLKPQELQPLQFVNLQWSGLELTLTRGDNPAVPNYEIQVAAQEADAVWKALLQTGAQEIHDEGREMFRVACGIPKLGQDIRQRDLPQETGQERALHFSKGCYVGQEIVERIRSRGAVHRGFVGFEVEGRSLSAGARVQSEGKDVGEITSVATVPAAIGERRIALGYLRKEFMLPGKELTAGDTKVTLAGLPFPTIET